jgi:biopolymer transport protein ExbB
MDRSYLAPVLRSAIATDGSAQQAARVDADAEATLGDLERGFRLLDSITQTAPLLGLFGTVLGMIDAFRSLQTAGAAVDPSLLAGGIWVALLTTAVGLGIAMPTGLALTWFEARVAADRMWTERALARIRAPGVRFDEGRRATSLPLVAAHAG